MDSIPFNSLKTAKSAATLQAEKTGAVKANRHEAHRIRKETRARLVAQEYVRNGMMFKEAWKTVTQTKSLATNNIMKVLGNQTDVFMDELSRIINKSDIDRDQALHILWSMVNTSILDFLDDNGCVLTVRELKALPRVMQIMLSEIDVTTSTDIIKDKKGKPVLDDNGSPYLKTNQRVKIKLPEKMVALSQLAQMMKWIGPANSTTVNINIGRMMSDADARTKRVSEVYDVIPTDVTPRLDKQS